MNEKITYIVLLQPQQKVLKDADTLKSLEDELPQVLKCCFRNASIENAERLRSFLSLPVNEEYKEIYSVTLKDKITQEQRCSFEQNFSNYKSRKIMLLDELVK